ncbi:MAG TPA: anhydro-N-acetylmuramic acid kinase [Phycisphaerales bacterium]|nr:anhydro-N-acetylmuramic acid kinase [Phycisphaerales bacterium]
MSRLFIGVMTGTSIDGLDAALVELDGRGVDGTVARLVRAVSLPLGACQRPLRELADQTPMTAGAIAELCRDFSLLHADAITRLRGGDAVEAACVHGQTVFHRPPVSWQLVSAPLVAHTARVPVVADLRAADLATGGQGAPLTPLSDYVLFRDRAHGEARIVVNLGGFANATLLGAAAGERGFKGRDLCTCNQLLDLVARRTMGAPFDESGAAALAADPDDDALDDLLGILRVQGAAGRSLGTGDEASAWIGRHWKGGAGVPGAALAASACEAIGQVIGDEARRADAQRVIVAGGGVRNRALMRAIEGCSSCRVEESAAHGVPVELREAVGWAVLGALAWDGEALPLRHITGASADVRAGIVARV